MKKDNIFIYFVYIAIVSILTGCASTYDYQPSVGHPAHPESNTALMLQPVSPYQMEYPYSVTPEEIEEHSDMNMQNQENMQNQGMNSMEGGSHNQ